MSAARGRRGRSRVAFDTSPRDEVLLTCRTPATNEAGESIELRAGVTIVGRRSERRMDPRPFDYRGQRVFVTRKEVEAQGPPALFEMLNRGF